MSEEAYLGFGADLRGEVVRLFAPHRVERASLDQLSPMERRALELDRSPALYHWNDLIHVSPDGAIDIVYARGKDFVPFSALEYVEQLRSRLADDSLGPVTLQMQPYQTCNDDCTFCCTTDYRRLPIYKGQRFSRAEWMELIDRHADGGGRVVEIIGGGEPTLHPDIVDVLRHIAKHGLKAYLFTNGSKLAPSNLPLIEAIVEACVILTVSLDGYENRHLVHRKLTREQTMATFEAMELIHRLRDPKAMAFYNSFILTGGPNQASNLSDLHPCVERQKGWVDSIHVQNDFVSLSHLHFDKERTRVELQRTMDDFFRDTYLYFNYPLIARFDLRVPYQLSTHNRPSSEFEYCPRSLLAPTVESGSYQVWPCGKYAGEAKPEHQSQYETMQARLQLMRRSPDRKNGMACDPCIHSSYNQSLLEIGRLLDRKGTFYHFYDRRILERTMDWPNHSAGSIGRANVSHTYRASASWPGP